MDRPDRRPAVKWNARNLVSPVGRGYDGVLYTFLIECCSS